MKLFFTIDSLFYLMIQIYSSHFFIFIYNIYSEGGDIDS